MIDAEGSTVGTWLSLAGVAYLVLCLWVILNPVLVAAGWPLPHSATLLEGAQKGARGLMLLATCGAGIAVAAVLSGRLQRMQWYLMLALAAWMVGPALSLMVLGSLEDGRYWPVAISGCGVGFAAAVVRAEHLAWLLRMLGWLFGWGSVAAGVSQLTLGWPGVLIAGDQRHVLWLADIGIRVDGVSILNGLSPGRVFLSMTAGLLFVILLRQIPRSGRRWGHVAVLVGLALAMIWSGARVGVLAVSVGVVASLLPWPRWPRWLALGAALAIPLVPLLASQFLRVAENSAQWRFDLWDSYLVQPDLWSPFGLGPHAPSTAIRGHAHNQFLESLASGGWIALAGLLALLYLGLRVARSADDNHMTYAVVFALCGIFAFDVVTFGPSSESLNSAFLIGVTVIVNAAGSPPHDRLLRETPDGAHV